jgi:hypothetical protein
MKSKNSESAQRILVLLKNDANNLMEPDLIENSNFNAPVAWYYPVPGRLLIFKSTTKHCVERHEDDDIRISLAYNFNKIL